MSNENWSGFLMQPYPLINFEMQKYYQNEPIFNVEENLDQHKSIGTHWIASYINFDNIIYFESFGVEHIPKRSRKTQKQKKCYNKYL